MFYFVSALYRFQLFVIFSYILHWFNIHWARTGFIKVSRASGRFQKQTKNLFGRLLVQLHRAFTLINWPQVPWLSSYKLKDLDELKRWNTFEVHVQPELVVHSSSLHSPQLPSCKTFDTEFRAINALCSSFLAVDWQGMVYIAGRQLRDERISPLSRLLSKSLTKVPNFTVDLHILISRSR
jgi:hypothetical protein